MFRAALLSQSCRIGDSRSPLSISFLDAGAASGDLGTLNTRRAGRTSAFHAVSAQLLRFVKRSVGPGEGLDDSLARPVLCHSD